MAGHYLSPLTKHWARWVRGETWPPVSFAPRAGCPAFRGTGYIAGTVTVEGVPAARPVRVYDRETGVLVAETQSAADGTYLVDNLAGGREYIVLAVDTARVHNAVVQDRIVPAGVRRGSVAVPWSVLTGDAADTAWALEADGTMSTAWQIVTT